MVSLKLFLLSNGSIMLSKVVAIYLVVVASHQNTNLGYKHLLLVVECEQVIVTITSYATRIAIAIASKFPLPNEIVNMINGTYMIYNLLELSFRF
jgi:hypothetical protein